MRSLVALVFLALSIISAYAQPVGGGPGPQPPPDPWIIIGNTINPPVGYKIITSPSVIGSAPFNIPPGSAPTSPTNGDIWETSSGMFIRVNGVTVGPLAGISSSNFHANEPITVSFGGSPTVATFGFDYTYAGTFSGIQTFTAAPVININGTTLQAAQAGTILRGANANGTDARFEIDSYAATAHFTGVRADGTAAAPTTLQANDSIVSLNAFGYNGSAYVGPQAAFRCYAAQNWTTGPAYGTYCNVAVTANGGSTLAESIRFENDGGITVPSTVTGGDEGAGTINAAGLYVNGVAVSTGGASIASAAQHDIAYYTGTLAIGGAAISGLVLASTSANPTAYGGASCTNQFITALSATGAATCNNVTNSYLSAGSFTNITGVGTLTAGTWNATIIALAYGGTNANLTASNGGVIYSTASAFAILSGTATSGQCLLSGSNAAPSWGSCSSGSGTVTSVDIINGTGLSESGTCNSTTTISCTLNVALTAGTNISISSATVSTTVTPQPGGRLTLTASTPVMVATASSQTTLRYDCYHGANYVPVYNGSSDVMLAIGSCEITDAMQSSGTGVLNSGGVFDVWAVNVSSTLTLCVATNGSGGGWASDTGGSNTARGTGYSKLDTTTRPYITNANSLSSCYNGSTNEGAVSANQATYLGSIYTSAAGQVSFTLGAAASGGTAALIGVWNAYNRVKLATNVVDSGTSYTYGTNTVRQARASSGNQVQSVYGLNEDGVMVAYTTVSSQTNSAIASTGIGLDSTSAYSGGCSGNGYANTSSASISTIAPSCSLLPGVGIHTITALESAPSGANATFDDVSTNNLAYLGSY